jgi:hypothetical protein
MVGVPLQIAYDGCPKIHHVIPPLWCHECHLTTLVTNLCTSIEAKSIFKEKSNRFRNQSVTTDRKEIN